MLQTILGALFAQMLATTPAPQFQPIVASTLSCVAFSAGEAHAGGKHIFVCGNVVTGELLGAVLRRNGAVYCNLTGAVDLSRGCATISGCGLFRSTC
jgi:hypothetical protein